MSPNANREAGQLNTYGEYIGTVGDGVMAATIRNYVETQGTPEEKEDYKQMNLLDLTRFRFHAAAPRMPRSLLHECAAVSLFYIIYT